jgi:hypothetical protein
MSSSLQHLLDICLRWRDAVAAAFLRGAVRRLRLKPGDVLVIRDHDTYDRVRRMVQDKAFQIDFRVPFLLTAPNKNALEAVHQNFNARQWIVDCRACGWLQIRNDFDWGFGSETYVDDPKKLYCPRCGDECGVIIAGLGAAR